MADTPEVLQAYKDGLSRGMEMGREMYQRKVLRLLRTRHRVAMGFAAAEPSPYWVARRDLLEQLVREVGEL